MPKKETKVDKNPIVEQLESTPIEVKVSDVPVESPKPKLKPAPPRVRVKPVVEVKADYTAVYRKPHGNWKTSGAMKGSMERKYKLAECKIPIEDVDRIIAYKRLIDNGIIPTEAEMLRERILRG